MSRKRKVLIALVALLILYAGSYIVVSRRAYRVADAYGMVGYYFVLPAEDHPERFFFHVLCVVVYYPLIMVDEAVGCGRHPSMSEPLYRIS